MADADQEILIKILTAYEGGGIDAAKRAATDLQATVSKNSSAGKELAAVQSLMNNNAGKAAQIFNGLSGVMRGGMDSATSLTTALRGVGAVLGVSGPIAIALSTVGLLATGIMQWKRKAEEAGEAARKAGEEQAKAAEDARKALEDLNKAKQDAVVAEVTAISERLTTAAAAAKELRDTLATMENAQLELEFARLDQAVAKGEMSKEDAGFTKARRKVETERGQLERAVAGEQAGKAGQSSAINEARASAAAAQAAAEQAEAAAAAAATARAEADAKAKETERIFGGTFLKENQDKVDRAKAEAEAAAEVERAARQDADDASVASAGATGAIDKVMEQARAEIDKANQRIAVLETQIATKNVLLTNTAIGKTSTTAAREQAAAAEQEKLRAERAEAARKAREEAEANLPPEARLARAKRAGVAPGQRLAGTTYIGEAAGNTQDMAREAIDAAGRKIMAGEDDAAVIAQLVQTLQRLGAIIPNWSRLQSELDLLDGKIDLVAAQTKNNRR